MIEITGIAPCITEGEILAVGRGIYHTSALNIYES
jgi:hypothetical protein